MPGEYPEPTDFLCERCGYILSGLRSSDACPECGQAIAYSHPDSRTGSPWQQGQRLGVWRNLLFLARSPWRAYGHVRVDLVQARRLEAENTAWAGAVLALLGACIALTLALGESGSLSLALLVGVVTLGVSFLFFVILLLFLTWVERSGIRTLGRMRHRRITRAVAETIVAHAAAGWIIGSLLTWAGWLIGMSAAYLGERHAWAMWELTLTAPLWMPVVGFMAGLLCFETLVYVGVLRMRYANPPEAAPRLDG